MPQITVEQVTFERLQSCAKPLVDTPDSVVNRALDALEGLALKPDDRPAGTQREFVGAGVDPNQLPDLKHTKVLAASVDETPVRPANWNSLLRELLVRAIEHFESFDEVQQLCAINMVPVVKDDEGYKYLPEAQISYQGVPANVAATAVVALAQALGASLQVDFQWRRKDQAFRPGESARLQVPSP